MNNYKLKEQITKEMLESVGFVFDEEEYKEDGTMEAKRLEKNGKELYALLYTPWWISNRNVVWNQISYKKDITPYIQDLIDKGWVEESEVNLSVREIEEARELTMENGYMVVMKNK